MANDIGIFLHPSWLASGDRLTAACAVGRIPLPLSRLAVVESCGKLPSKQLPGQAYFFNEAPAAWKSPKKRKKSLPTDWQRS
jgi:hypothetical protein